MVVEGGADIIDIKNVKEGSLGAQAPWVIQEVVKEFKGTGMMCSATLGDLPYKPGTAALAAYGAAMSGVDYVKAGLHGARNYHEAVTMMEHVVRAIRMVSREILAVASGYADFRRFGGVSYTDIVRAAKDAHADVVMVDTAIKDGKNLFDAMTFDEIQEFTQLGHDAGLIVALAGSVKKEHLADLAETKCDIVGIRGAVCDGADRTLGITRKKVEEFMAYAREISPRDGKDLLSMKRLEAVAAVK
jgi:uncharacterized protein (UPF0264 family)